MNSKNPAPFGGPLKTTTMTAKRTVTVNYTGGSYQVTYYAENAPNGYPIWVERRSAKTGRGLGRGFKKVEDIFTVFTNKQHKNRLYRAAIEAVMNPTTEAQKKHIQSLKA